MGNAFKVAAAKSTINWTMRKRAPEPNQEFTPILRTIDFVSTLDIGWVPDDAVDFFNAFMVDLHKKWRVLLEEADTHLDHSVSLSSSSNKGHCAWAVFPTVLRFLSSNRVSRTV